MLNNGTENAATVADGTPNKDKKLPQTTGGGEANVTPFWVCACCCLNTIHSFFYPPAGDSPRRPSDQSAISGRNSRAVRPSDRWAGDGAKSAAVSMTQKFVDDHRPMAEGRNLCAHNAKIGDK
ncbi:hypothetical protein niasHT_024538 [Heterodera trifolii]|uniref:Uncharacterized protein n=1 Tax=Heterodera trifolii TaxID=157864 RepID=A0ABD2K885_9BILA